MWKKIRESLFNWFFLVLFTLMAIIFIFTFVTNMSEIWDTSEENVVEETYTSKGLYFGIQYYAHLTNGGTHRILKSDYMSLEKGDTFTAFFNSFSLKDFLLFTTIMLLASGGFLALASLFVRDIFGQKKWFRKVDEKKGQFMEAILLLFKKKGEVPDIFKRIGMIALILPLSILLLLVAKNVAYKVMPFGKTTVTAEVLDHEIKRSSGPRAPSDTYTLTYHYKDIDGTLYKTAKNVSSATYNKYKDKRFIPIMYRNRVPYDTFIDNRSMGEFLSPFLSFTTFIFAVVGYLLYFLIKKYVEVWGIPFIQHRPRQ